MIAIVAKFVTMATVNPRIIAPGIVTIARKDISATIIFVKFQDATHIPNAFRVISAKGIGVLSRLNAYSIVNVVPRRSASITNVFLNNLVV
jgi:hypothetical protein